MMVSKKVYLARAVPIEPAILAAALTSYIETKASLTTFFCCANHAQSSSNALGRLPLELLYKVASLYREAAHGESLREWKDGFDCITDKCRPVDHLTRNLIRSLGGKAMQDYVPLKDVSSKADSENFGEFMVDWLLLRDDWQDVHMDRMFEYREEIEDGTSKLSIYQSVGFILCGIASPAE